MVIRNWICDFSKLKFFDKACGRIMKVAFTAEVLYRALLRTRYISDFQYFLDQVALQILKFGLLHDIF